MVPRGLAEADRVQVNGSPWVWQKQIGYKSMVPRGLAEADRVQTNDQ